MSRLIIGIDPGFTGAIATLFPDGPVLISDMPVLPNAKGKTELNHPRLLTEMRASLNGRTGTVWLERVGTMPRQGISSAFRFGQQLGAIEMAAAACEHELRYVTPAVWKAYFGLSSDKGVARGYAMKRFPQLADQLARVKDDGRAEALLIALYGSEHMK